MTASRVLTGGGALERYLSDIARKLESGGVVNVGWFTNAKYPDGTPVAYVAAIQEYGATINREAHQQTIYREVNASRTGFNKNGRFVKRDKANFESTHQVGAYTIKIPARPYFRTMIAAEEGEWGPALGHVLTEVRYDVKGALGQMGANITKQLQTSIRNWQSPPNAPSTVAEKGFNQPLIDTKRMWQSVSWEVKS